MTLTAAVATSSNTYMVLLTCANRWWTHGVGWIVHNETSDTTRHVHLPTCMHAPLPLAMRWPYELVPSRPPPDRRSGKFRCTLARIGVAGGAARSTLKWGVSENRPSFAGGLTGPMPPQTLPEQHAEGTVTPDVGRTIPHPAHRGDGHTGAATHSTHGETAGPQEPAPSAKHTTHMHAPPPHPSRQSPSTQYCQPNQTSMQIIRAQSVAGGAMMGAVGTAARFQKVLVDARSLTLTEMPQAPGTQVVFTCLRKK